MTVAFKKIVLATKNAGKIKEFNEILSTINCEIIPAQQFNMPDVEETGLTFVENAILKARTASEISKLPALADDSGLCVDALNGSPGLYSARFAGIGATNQDNCLKLLQSLKGVEKNRRSAFYHCCIVLLRHPKDPSPMIFYANWHGTILEKAQGKGGFGYDPLFFVPERNCSAAELSPQEKNTLSHRGKALQQFKHYLTHY